MIVEEYETCYIVTVDGKTTMHTRGISHLRDHVLAELGHTQSSTDPPAGGARTSHAEA